MPQVGAEPALKVDEAASTLRHAFVVRLTHWITVLCFLALLVSGLEIVVSHPRFYWGETGNVLTKPLFQIPIPASRKLVQTGYGYVLPDQNGWSRALHFQTAWLLILTGLLYVIWGFVAGHFAKNLVPGKDHLSWGAVRRTVISHLRFERPSEAEAWSYNLLQRGSYLFVVFALVPLLVWSGLALSPAFDSVFPAAVNLLGGRQSARTIHFFATLALVAFAALHVGMVWFAGFWGRTKAMITGRAAGSKEGA